MQLRVGRSVYISRQLPLLYTQQVWHPALPNARIMHSLFLSLVGLFLMAVSAGAAADYPGTPADLSTPVQQRLAISGMNCTI